MNPTVLRKQVWRVIAVLALLYVSGCVLAGIYLAEQTLHYPRQLVDASMWQAARDAAQTYSATLSEVSITAQDGTPLRAWFFQSEKPNGNAVLLLHGYTNNRAAMLTHAQIFLAAGYSVLIPDSRGHGSSGGDTATFGLLEAEDIHRWVTSLIETAHPRCVYALASSMGSAQLVMSLAVEMRFCAVIAESTYATFREVSFSRLGVFFHMRPWLGRTVLRLSVETALLYSRMRYGVDLTRANPIEAIGSTRVPTLLIHGSDDRLVPPRNSELLHAANPAATMVWIVPGVWHGATILLKRAEFDRRVLEWFATHSTPP